MNIRWLRLAWLTVVTVLAQGECSHEHPDR
jgi:hypothetical protein